MALIVEDGTGKSNAESYISVADADTYHSNLGNTSWAALETGPKEILLRKATNYMIQVYRDLWNGLRSVSGQALDWPRSGVVVDDFVAIDIDEMPNEILNACAELALKSNASELLADKTRGVKRKKIGPLDTTFDTSSPEGKRYSSVDAMLNPYIRFSKNSIPLILNG